MGVVQLNCVQNISTSRQRQIYRVVAPHHAVHSTHTLDIPHTMTKCGLCRNFKLHFHTQDRISQKQLPPLSFLLYVNVGKKSSPPLTEKVETRHIFPRGSTSMQVESAGTMHSRCQWLFKFGVKLEITFSIIEERINLCVDNSSCPVQHMAELQWWPHKPPHSFHGNSQVMPQQQWCGARCVPYCSTRQQGLAVKPVFWSRDGHRCMMSLVPQYWVLHSVCHNKMVWQLEICSDICSKHQRSWCATKLVSWQIF